MDRPSFQRLNPTLVGLGIAASVSLAVLGARQLRVLERLELVAFDHQIRLIPPRNGWSPRVAVVEVSEQDIQNLGYPISDADLARAIRILIGSGASAVGVDIYRDIPVPPGSEELAALLTGQRRVIVPTKLADAGGHGVAPPAVLEGTRQVGFTNLVTDLDGSVRRGLLYMDDGRDGVGTAMSLSLALIYLGDEGIHPAADPEDARVMRLGAARFEPLVPGFGGYADVDAGGYQYALDYRGGPVPGANLTDLLAGKADPELFRDRIVILGVSAESLTDRFRVPWVGVDIPGAELHGRMADQLVRSALGEMAPVSAIADWQESILVVVAAVLGAALMLWMHTGWGLALLALGGLAALWGLGWWSLLYCRWTPVLAPAVAWASSLSFVAVYARSRERRERAEIMQLFSRHVTKQVAAEVWRHRDEFLEDGRPKPVRLTATILFVDMKAYSESAEKMDPAELMEWIDGFLGAMAKEVLNRGGLVEDYFGDGMMACYGIPVPRTNPGAIREDANNAVLSALGMEQTLRRLNAQWRIEGRPLKGIRIGICTGSVVAGSMGSAKRLKYGVVGDAVVTAQRLESLGRDRVEHDFDEQPSRILISAETLALLDPIFRTEPVGEFIVKGKHEPVAVSRVLGRVGADVGCRLEESEESGGSPS